MEQTNGGTTPAQQARKNALITRATRARAEVVIFGELARTDERLVPRLLDACDALAAAEKALVTFLYGSAL